MDAMSFLEPCFYGAVAVVIVFVTAAVVCSGGFGYLLGGV